MPKLTPEIYPELLETHSDADTKGLIAAMKFIRSGENIFVTTITALHLAILYGEGLKEDDVDDAGAIHLLKSSSAILVSSSSITLKKGTDTEKRADTVEILQRQFGPVYTVKSK